jgi:voltage-gated potassium channel Kch
MHDIGVTEPDLKALDQGKSTEDPDGLQEQLEDQVVKVTNATKWKSESLIPHSLTQIIGIVWVLMLGSAPLLAYKMGDRPLTTTAVCSSVSMWIALFGGLYMFTNIILFQSPHFEGIRSLTIIECTYFMTQVITTVGYGDITPAKARGQVFVGLYVVLAFFVIAIVVSEMQAVVLARVQKYKDELAEKAGIRSSDMTNMATFRPEKPSPLALVISVSIFIAIATVWVFFFHFFPGENKTWMEATYMALVTLTTVGFGAVTPVTEGGMLFGSFVMFLGTSALVSVVTNFSSFALEMSEWEAWNPKVFFDGLTKLHGQADPKKGVSELDFLIFTLTHKNILSQEQVDSIRDGYKNVKPNKRGSVSVKSIASSYAYHGDDEDPLGLASDSEQSPRTPKSSPRNTKNSGRA